MMRIYCRCGYPLWLAARWTGDDIVLVVHDGNDPPHRKQPIITRCPQCQAVMAGADLAEQTSPLWFRQLERPRAS